MHTAKPIHAAPVNIFFETAGKKNHPQIRHTQIHIMFFFCLQERQFIHADDTVAAIATVMQRHDEMDMVSSGVCMYMYIHAHMSTCIHYHADDTIAAIATVMQMPPGYA
jgi:hypothetical protein